MAGDAWVMDIIVHTMIGVGKWLLSLWRVWHIEILLGTSFVMQLVLSLLAGYRWRGASTSLRRAIWLAYVGADYVATTALGNLSISGSSGERQLIAFWAPFFLLHLGGPDNITAYQFQDNELSMRAVLTLVVQVGATLIIVYASVSAGSWALILAAWLMFFVCVTKCVERTLALRRANLDNIRRSLRGQQHRHRRSLVPAVGDDTDLLLRAHYLFHICKHAMVDSLVEDQLDEAKRDQTRNDLFNLEHFELLEVMEMELSLMYDFLYTKASVMYTWHGYGIRAVSPVAALGALLLVELSNYHGARRHKQSDVVITRVLLVATFVLETVSLLRTLGSSWTGFLICSRLRPSWVRHEVFCRSRWHRFRRALASVGLLASVEDGHHKEKHRRWSGNIGQLNLFEQLTTTSGLLADEQVFCAGNQVQIKPAYKKVVYRKLRHKVVYFRGLLKELGAEKAAEKVKLATELSKDRGLRTLKFYRLDDDLRYSIGSELQVGIITWHIGTDIFLNVCDVQEAGDHEAPIQVQKHAVRTLSNYMMHLLVERPHMLPDMVNRRHLLEQARRELTEVGTDHLTKIWKDPKIARGHSDDSKQNSSYLDDGIQLCRCLIDREKYVFTDRYGTEQSILGVILEVWVDMLFYASYRCSKESHAKQLAHGGELTTIVWLLAEHAGLFIVSKARNKQGGETNGAPQDTQTSTGNTQPPEGTLLATSVISTQLPEPATHKRTSSWSCGGDVMIQLQPQGFNSDAYYDLHTHDYLHQKYV